MEKTLEMSEKLMWELEFLWIAFLSGFFVRAGYDILIILRQFVKHGYFLVGVEDFIYCVIAAGWTFMLFYEVNNGSPRGFALFAMAVGVCLCHFGLSPVNCFVVGKIISLLLWPIRQVVKFLKKFVIRC